MKEDACKKGQKLKLCCYFVPVLQAVFVVTHIIHYVAAIVGNSHYEAVERYPTFAAVVISSLI